MSSTAIHTIILMLTTFIAKLLGFVREQVLAYYYGTSTVSDIFSIVYSIPTIIFSGMGAAILTCYITVYTNLRKDGQRGSVSKFSNNVITMIFLLSFVILAVFLLFDEMIVKIFAPGFTDDVFQRAVSMARIIMISILFIGIYFILQGYLQVRGKFFAVGLTSLPLNISVIISIVLSVQFGEQILAYGTVAGYGFTFLMFVLVAMFAGYRYKFTLNLKDKNVHRLIKLVLPIFLGKSITQINIMLDRTIASTLPAGNIAALNYANRVVGFITSVFVLSVATAIFPRLSSLNADNDIKKLKSTFITSSSIMTLLVLPISAGVMIFSKEIISILFMRGAFTEDSANITASVLFCYAFGLLAFSIKDVMLNVFYAIEDTVTPTVNSIIALFLNIAMNVFFIQILGVRGLALATSISSTITLLMLFYSLHKKIGPLGTKNLLLAIGKMGVATAGMSVAVILTNYIMVYLTNSMLFSLIISVFVGVIVYAALNILLRTKELGLVVIGFCEKFKIGSE